MRQRVNDWLKDYFAAAVPGWTPFGEEQDILDFPVPTSVAEIEALTDDQALELYTACHEFKG